MKRERVRSKHGFKGFGVFILGWFLGLISTLGILVGVGFWAYTSISVRKIEKWTKSEITDNKGLEDLTLKKAVGIVQGITSNSGDAYTIAKMEEDFGVKLIDDTLYGISTSKIKNAPIKDLEKAFNDTVDSITFNNVLSFMDVEQDTLGLLNTILETKVEYYINNNKLYSDKEYQTEVEFDYTIKESAVEFANGTHTVFITDGVKSIKPRFSDLPLNTAMSTMEDATKDLKIYEILGYERSGEYPDYTYTDNGKDVSGVMASLAEYSINDLSDQEKLNEIYIYEVMGYKDLGNGEFSYINDSNQEVRVTGTMKTIAGMTIGDLSKPETINNLKIYEVMDYKYDTVSKKYYKYNESTESYSDEITGTMKTLAGKTINDLSDPDFINNLQVWEVMGFERTGTEGNYSYEDNDKPVEGIMLTIAEKTINQLDDAGAFNDVTVADAMGYYKNPADGLYYSTYIEATGTYSDKVEGLFAHIAETTVQKLPNRINALTIGEVLDIEEDEATGIIKALHGTKIEELSNEKTINDIYIYQVMDYTPVEGGGYTYVDDKGDTQPVTGAMKVLAGKTIGELSDPDTINGLKVYEVLGYYENGGKYYKTFDGETYKDEVGGAIKALAGLSISELNDEAKGINSITLGEILDVDNNATGVINALKGFTLGELKGEINKLKIYQVMGYYYDDVTEKYYTTYNAETNIYSGEVTGIMGALAGKTVNGLEGAIDGLMATDVFNKEETTILKLFSDAELTTLTITNMPNQVVNKINNATIEELVEHDIITGVDKSKSNYQLIKGLTILDVIELALG